MAAVYRGKYLDLFQNMKVNQSVFVKCTTRTQRTSISGIAYTYAKRFKVKFTTSQVNDQLKITRIA